MTYPLTILHDTNCTLSTSQKQPSLSLSLSDYWGLFPLFTIHSQLQCKRSNISIKKWSQIIQRPRLTTNYSMPKSYKYKLNTTPSTKQAPESNCLIEKEEKKNSIKWRELKHREWNKVQAVTTHHLGRRCLTSIKRLYSTTKPKKKKNNKRKK